MRIETKRLILRRFNNTDAKQAHELFCDEEAMRMVGMYPPFTAFEDTLKRISRWEEYGKHLAIVLKQTEELVGYIIVKSDSEELRDDTRELGFAIISRHRNKGYMKEAITEILNDLRKQKVVYVWACCIDENIASARLIQDMGFEFQKNGEFEAPNDKTYNSLEFRLKLGK